MLLKWLEKISPFRGMPVDLKKNTSKIISVTELVSFYYFNSGTLTADTGQDAGTAIVAYLNNTNIKNRSGKMEATKNDTSLAFTYNALTKSVPISRLNMEGSDEATESGRLTSLVSGLNNGEFVVDYTNGIIYGKKATNTSGANISMTYKINISTSAITDTSGNQISSFGGASTVADYRSPADFTAVYTSASTITISGVNFTLTDASQIVYVKVIANGNTGNIYLNGQAGYVFRIVTATGVITAYKDGAVVNIFASGDVYEVGINDKTKAYEKATDSTKVIDQAPVYYRETSKLTLQAATAFAAAAAWANVGGEIDMTGFNRLYIWTTIDIQTGPTASSGVQMQAVIKHTSAGATGYSLPLIAVSSPASSITPTYYTFADADQFVLVPFDVPNGSFVQIQVKAATTQGDGTLAAVYTKEWK